MTLSVLCPPEPSTAVPGLRGHGEAHAAGPAASMGPSRSPTAALRPAAPHRSLCPELPGPGWVTLIRALLRPAAFPDATEGAAATPARGLKGRCGRGAVRGPVAVRPPTDGADARPAAPRRPPPAPPSPGAVVRPAARGGGVGRAEGLSGGRCLKKKRRGKRNTSYRELFVRTSPG